MSAELPTALPEEAQRWVSEIGELLGASSADERMALCRTIEGAVMAMAVSGTDDFVLTARLLKRLAFIATAVTREESRALAAQVQQREAKVQQLEAQVRAEREG